METARNPLWKSALWFLGVLVYAAGVTGLCLFLFVNLLGDYPIHRYFGDAATWGYQVLPVGFWQSLFTILVYCLGFSPFGLWVGLLAVGGWQMIVHRHKKVGMFLLVLAILAAVSSVRILAGYLIVHY